MLILTPEYLYVKIPKEDALRFVEESKNGDWSWTGQIHSNNMVRLDIIHRVEANKKDSMVDMYLDTTLIKKENFYFFIDDPAVKQQFLEKLYAYLEDSHTYRESQISRLKTILKPTYALLVTGLAGWLLTYLATRPLEARDAYKVRVKTYALFSFLTSIGPLPIIIIAGTVAFFTVIVIIARLKNPPFLVSMNRRK